AIHVHPASQAAAEGASVTLTAAATGSPAPTVQWSRNGTIIGGATNPTLTIGGLEPLNSGVYTAAFANVAGTVVSDAAIVGVNTTSKVIGTGSEVGSNIFVAANGNTFDQVLLSGAAATVTADAGQITRTSFLDLTDDIVQIEFSGAGTLSLVLDSASGPVAPAKYNQAVTYLKGHVGVVIVGADETTNVGVFSVGRITAVNQTLFRSDVTYDGLADIAFIAISSANGKFGGLRAANASFFATKGITGIYAPGVQFAGPVFIGDIGAFDQATPVLILGSAGDTRITGGDLKQENGKAVRVSGLAQLKFAAGTDSHGTVLAAKTNQARLEQNGVDVTAQIVVNPGP
ncbi:MAG: immunoglobulin domain-containing protein, partial [Opitutaceae bacterium]